MVGIGQHGLGADIFDLLRCHGFHGSFGADDDERRGMDLAVRRVITPARANLSSLNLCLTSKPKPFSISY